MGAKRERQRKRQGGTDGCETHVSCHLRPNNLKKRVQTYGNSLNCSDGFNVQQEYNWKSNGKKNLSAAEPKSGHVFEFFFVERLTNTTIEGSLES